MRETGRAKQEEVKNVILQLCSEHYLSLRTIAELLGRKPNSMRNHYVNPMLDEGLLELKYPDRDRIIHSRHTKLSQHRPLKQSSFNHSGGN